MILYIIGFILTVFGLSTIVLYINLFSFGYNFKEYLMFLIKLPEFYYLIIGLVLLNISILKKRRKLWKMYMIF